MPRLRGEVQDVFRLHGDAYRHSHGPSMSADQLRAMRAIEVCRTAVLGGHVEACEVCGAWQNSYNSCLMGSEWLWGVGRSHRPTPSHSQRIYST